MSPSIKLLSLAAVGFGSIYTMTRKLQSIQQINLQGEGLQQFNKPIFQAFCIFVGMALTMFAVPFTKSPSSKSDDITPEPSENPQFKDENIFVYIIPSLLDVVGTIFDTAGIFYTSVSISQMLKGFVVVFTYLISIVLFGKKMRLHQHTGVALIFLGELIIGYSNIGEITQKFSSFPLLGNSLIVLSQLIFSLMFIYEQIILKHYRTTVVNVVAWEGVWGATFSLLFIFLFSFIDYTPTNCRFFELCRILPSNPTLLIAILATGACIGPFNYFGMNITKVSSALHRCTICSLRMVVVWAASLLVGWEQFRWLQLFGYVVLTLGTFIFNEVLPLASTNSSESPSLQSAKLVKNEDQKLQLLTTGQ